MPTDKTWVDPRSYPDPPSRVSLCVTTSKLEDINGLLELCMQGRVYDIERWIIEGRPIQAISSDQGVNHPPPSPMGIAVKTNQYALAQLLLVNGYRLIDDRTFPLATAMEEKKWDFMELLWTWEPDTSQVDIDSVIGTYRGDLIERFWRAGLDLTQGCALAYALAGGSNRALYGFIKRNLGNNPRFQFSINVALGYAVGKKKERAAALCVWAGANPHAQVPDIDSMDEEEVDVSSIAQRAVFGGSASIIKLLKPHPEKEDFNALFSWSRDVEMINTLSLFGMPSDWSEVIWRQVRYATWQFAAWSSYNCLLRLLELGGKITKSPKEQMKSIRVDIMRLDEYDFKRIIRLLKNKDVCAEAIYEQLIDSKRMKELLKARNLLPLPREPRTVSPTHYPISKEELEKMVWKKPTQVIAKEYGISDVALAKWCRAYGIKKPARGYWAKKAAKKRSK